jgi:hypothetical protein
MLPPQDDGARVDIVTDLTLAWPLAQYGSTPEAPKRALRRGLVQSVAGQLTASFASCLHGRSRRFRPRSPEASAPAQPRPVSGIQLGFRAPLDVLRIPRRRPDVNR